MPAMPCNRSPLKPVRRAGKTGTPPATDAPNSSWQPFALASYSRSGPCRAISCLFAVTTDLPVFSAPRRGLVYQWRVYCGAPSLAVSWAKPALGDETLFYHTCAVALGEVESERNPATKIRSPNT